MLLQILGVIANIIAVRAVEGPIFSVSQNVTSKMRIRKRSVVALRTKVF